VRQGKKGRVICAGCKGDMGEAETELDTHGCCLKCLELALREVDERLSAFGQGQEAGRRARERRRPRVKRVWRVGEEPVNLRFIFGPVGVIEAAFRCPGCELDVWGDYGEGDRLYECQCGAHLRLVLEPGLEELEEIDITTLPGASP